ncbi:MAG: DNA polymerase III subunit delta' C-terminal domain-containing protein, partial [Eubacteriales bacterium]|nr:DNA polymerase III subunit delta' C-terminal domain-containing protein [Eubacteriales bacterium]
VQTFSDIIGQNSIIDHLSGALRTGNISHAYILCGDAGSGRRTIARAFAAAMQCADLAWEDESMLPRPCGCCLSCLQAQTDNQPDIITVAHEKPGSIGVGEIRRMRADVQIKPYANPYKVYIVPDAEKMTVQAQNALLKTLEEPPAYAVILLIATGTDSFLPTILSRCVLLRMRAVGEEEIAKFLLDRADRPGDSGGQAGEDSGESAAPMTDEEAHVIARFAGGNPGRALQLSRDDDFLVLRDKTLDLLQHLRDTDAGAIAAFAAEMDAGRQEELMNLILMWYRDVLLYRESASAKNLIFGEDLQYIIEAAGTLSYEVLGQIIDIVAEASRRLHSNVAADAVLETMLLRIRGAYRQRQSIQKD